MFSRRTGRPRAPNYVAALAAEARAAAPAAPGASGAPLFDLTGSNPTTAGFDYAHDLLRVLVRAQSEALVYRPEPFGALPAREAVSRHWAGARVTSRPEPEDVLLTASTSEAYAFLFKLLCDPGDQILIPAPSYPLFEHLAELEGVQAVPYRLAYDGAWHVDLDSVRRALGPRSRGILVVTPNNPTGHYWTAAELEALGAFGLPIVSDEVFFEYPLRGAAPSPPPSPAGLLFALGGLSKLAGSPQLKLAWTVIRGPEAARREARERLELIADTFLSVGAPVQAALPELLRLAPGIASAIGARCRQNLAALEGALAGSPVTLLRVEGGWTAVLRLPGLAGEDELIAGLLREQRVLVQPGWFYDFDAAPYAVVSLLTPRDAFGEGIRRLVEHVASMA